MSGWQEKRDEMIDKRDMDRRMCHDGGDDGGDGNDMRMCPVRCKSRLSYVIDCTMF